ncbi:winged helix-turn-helix transcriptional regulator [Tsukamurella sp. 1534]|uniref:winged helix-turn-helix transcriptional regulator n=1 Tax=Tsukamurella sp. 1534 TaxID=1151061 RepID=UPI0002EEE65B|nr:winged helix-turn-helix transcriptional regulator [Tsukamurella sp. 1534]
MTQTASTDGQDLGLADIIHLLGHRQWTSIMQKQVGASKVINHHVTPGIVPALAAGLVDSDVWYGVNEISTPPADNRRATERTVGRWCAVWADLDFGTGKSGDQDTINAIIDDITAAYGTEPVFMTLSGHGVQPVWTLDPHDPATILDTPEKRARAVALLKRHGRLVQASAAARGVKADSVFDLPRVLRAPGTVNWKYPNEPVETAAIRGQGAPITVAQVEDALTTAGVEAMDADQPVDAPVVAAPSTWRYRDQGQQQCKYADDMIRGWAADQPAARHPWLVAQATRIAAARRHGCFTAGDALAAERELQTRFHVLCARAGDARAVGRFEVEQAIRYGQDLVATMPDARVAEELGDHEHPGGGGGSDLDALRALIGRPGQVSGETAAPALTTGTTELNDVIAEMGLTDEVNALPDTDDEQEEDQNPAAGAGSYIDEHGRLHLTGYTPDTDLEAIEGDFWTARPDLEQIFRVSLLAHAAPWAVLGQVIARTLAAIPPGVQIPPTSSAYAEDARVGGSLNLHFAIPGKSGAGKGESAKVAKLLAARDGYEIRGIGSGEGLAAMYCGPDPNDPKRNIMVRHQILVSINEVDALAALSARSGSTVDTVLREAYSGERLGREYRGANKMPVNDHTYRFVSVIGVQYARAGALLNRASGDGGTAQRLFWASTKDKRARAARAALHAYYAQGGVELPPIVRAPEILGSSWPHASRGEFILMPAAAGDEIAEHRLNAMEQEEDSESDLEAHSLFTRCKIAVAFAAMAGRTAVTDQDWELSGTAMAVSKLTRERTEAALQAAAHRDARERGELRGIEWEQAKTTEADERREKVASAARRILSVLADGPASARELRARLSKVQRTHQQAALDHLEADGLIAREDQGRGPAGGKPTVLFRLAEAAS